MRFMLCIYVEHIFLSSIKCMHTENNSADLESVLQVTRQIARESAAQFHVIFSALSNGCVRLVGA